MTRDEMYIPKFEILVFTLPGWKNSIYNANPPTKPIPAYLVTSDKPLMTPAIIRVIFLLSSVHFKMKNKADRSNTMKSPSE